MQTVTVNNYTSKSGAGNSETLSHTGHLNMRKRIGSTVYEVNVFFNQDARETMNDKIMRLIRNEAFNEKAA